MSCLLEKVLQAPQSKDVGFVYLREGMVRRPGVMESCIQRLRYWELRNVILFVCQDALLEAEKSSENWSAFSDFMAAVGQMQTLVHLQIKQHDKSTSAIPVEWMTSLLQQAGPRLKRLELSNVRLMGTCEAHKQLSEVAKTLTGLKSCSLEGVRLLDFWNAKYPSDGLMGALITLPALRDVVLESPSLTNMQIPTHPNNKYFFQGIETIQLTLPTNEFGTLGALSLAALRSQHLRSLELQILSKPDSNLQQTPMMDLAVAVGSSTSLRSFKLLGDPVSSNVIDPFLVQLAQKLEHNASSNLQTLHMTSAASSCRPCVGDALWNALQSNYTLEDIQIFCRYSVDAWSEIKTLDATQRAELEFFLALNRSGRKQLMKDTHRLSRDEWLEAFSVQAARNLDALYYYLGNNPWLFQPSSQDATKQTMPPPRENTKVDGEKRALELENQLLREQLALLQHQTKKGSKKWRLRRVLGRLRQKK